jgi:hypothetical protein
MNDIFRLKYRGVKEFLCARALFTYCIYVLFRIYDTKNTERVFLRYRYGNYREIPTDADQKIPTRYTTLVYMRQIFDELCASLITF